MNEEGVVVIGSTNVDLLYLLEELPKAGQTIFAKEYHENMGGKGNNQAIMIAKLTKTGTFERPKCLFLTAIGDDSFAQTLKTSFSKHLDNTETVLTFDNCATGRAVINVDKNGRNTIVLFEGANARLHPKHVDQFWHVIEQNVKVLVVQNEIPLETTAHAVIRGKNSGLMTIFNPAPAPLQPLSDLLLQSIDILCPNETEAISMLGKDNNQFIDKHELDIEDGKRIVKALFDKYVQQCPSCQKNLQILITMGSKGVIAYYDPKFSLQHMHNIEERQMEHFSVKKIERVVDTTGAGDAFVGSLSYFLSCGLSLKESLPLANAIASQTVAFYGTQSSYEYVDFDSVMKSKN
jgi:ribokinase